MKRVYIFILTVIMLFPIMIKGSSFTLGFDCPSKVTAGETIKCKLSVNQTGGVSSVGGNFLLDGLTYDKFNIATDKNGKSIELHVNTISKEGFMFGNVNGFPSSLTIGEVLFKVPSTAKAGDSFTVKIINVTGSDIAYHDLEGSDISKAVRIASNVNTLSSLSVTGANISFNENTLNYSATIDASSVTITAKATDSHATVSGTGTKTLKYGKNDFNIVVKAENGSKKTYVLSITRPDNRNTNNYLKSLSVDVGTINFNKDTTIYNINVDSNVKTAKISAEVEDSKANFVKNYGARSVTLKYGKNEILVKVSAENEKVKTYTINVNREDDRSNDNFLSSLTVTPGSINFDKNITSYTVNVDKSVTSVDIKATANDSKATVKVVSPKSLVDGTNEYKVIVQAENEKTKTYMVYVIKGEDSTSILTPPEPINPVDEDLEKNNNKIKNLSIAESDIDFKSDITNYEVKTKKDKLDLNIVLDNSNSTYVVEGNENLKPGSIVKIIVTSESGENKVYTIKIVDDGLSTIQLISICGMVLANLVVLVLLIKSKASK